MPVNRSLFAATMLLAIGPALSPAHALDTVRVAASSVSMLSIPVYIADVTGIARKNGIELEDKQFKGGPVALAAVISGGADFYLGATSSAIRAAEKGTGAIIVATLTSEYTINIAAKTSAVPGITAATPLPQRLAAIKGLRIGVTGPGSGTHQIVRYLLEQQGFDEKRDATIAFVDSGSQMLAALQAGNVDAVAAASPTSDLIVRTMGGVMLVNGAAGEYPGLEGFPFISVVSTKRWTDSHPDVTKRFVKSLTESAAVMHGDKVDADKARDAVHAKYFNSTPKDLFDAGWASMAPAFPANLTPTAKQMNAAVEFLNRFSEDKIKVAPGEVMTGKFAPSLH